MWTHWLKVLVGHKQVQCNWSNSVLEWEVPGTKHHRVPLSKHRNSHIKRVIFRNKYMSKVQTLDKFIPQLLTKQCVTIYKSYVNLISIVKCLKHFFTVMGLMLLELISEYFTGPVNTWLLMLWLLELPGHQQFRYWVYWRHMSLSLMPKELHNLGHLSDEK